MIVDPFSETMPTLYDIKTNSKYKGFVHRLDVLASGN
jgi:hypothetical protein